MDLAERAKLLVDLEGAFSRRKSAYSVSALHSSQISSPLALCLPWQYFRIITGMSFFSFSHAFNSSGIFLLCVSSTICLCFAVLFEHANLWTKNLVRSCELTN